MLIKQGNLLVSRIFVPSKLAVFAQMNRPEVLLFAADRAIFWFQFPSNCHSNGYVMHYVISV